MDRNFFDQLFHGLPQTIITLDFSFLVYGNPQVVNELLPIERDINHARQVSLTRLPKLPFDILKRIARNAESNSAPSG